MYLNSKTAEKTATEFAENRRFLDGVAGLHNGQGDAFRHAFWAAMNARDVGRDMAKKIGDTHETGSDEPMD